MARSTDITKHTSAPWEVVANSWQYTTVYAADGCPICRLDLEDWQVDEDNQEELGDEQSKVAAIIAAAPDMLEALRALVTTSVPFGEAMALARTAVAKAEGQS